MTSQEVLRAFQEGKISLEDAKKALTSIETSQEQLQARESGASWKEAIRTQTEAVETQTGDVGTQTEAIGTGLTPVRTPTALKHKEAIAIVGMSGKYPDASNLSEYWENLVQGKNAIREVPLSRWDPADYYDPNPAAVGKMYCKWLGALDGIEYFDPLFFRLSPAEAETMDPQQRLFLEEGYKAFEDAGYSPELLSNRKCGVYLGMMSHDYELLLRQQNISEKSILGSSSAIAAARIAYLLNLKGPALAIDTACSSSLVATHLACQALLNQEIDMALVGGVSLYLTPDSYVGMCAAGMLSADGQCKTFDASANGFVPGEGVGALVLKRLADAEADHDQISGVIIGSGINQDGTTNGITAPSVKSQIELEREVYEKYQIDPASISYVETHGTGTKLGDPIELEALATVFQEKTQCKQYCAIGSVKTNIGHTSAAAGVASLQKVVLAMKAKKLVPSLHFEQPNEHFDFKASPFYVNTAVQDWHTAAEGRPLRAGVSSFGFSGTNAHLVVEEYMPKRDLRASACVGHAGEEHTGEASSPLRYGISTGTMPYRSGELASPTSPTASPCLFVLSAKSGSQLRSYAQEMKEWIQAHSELTLEDIAFTLQVGREAMDYRLAIEASSREVLLQRLEGFVENRTPRGVHTAQIKKGTNDATIFDDDADAQSLLHIWFQKKNLTKIAQAWVRGVYVDWKLLYGLAQGTVPGAFPLDSLGFGVSTLPVGRWLESMAFLDPLEGTETIGTGPISALPRRISLPTYPFARERYWLPPTTVGTCPGSAQGSTPTATPATLHPLVQRNTSTLWEQQFSSTFHGNEFFLADHVISGQCILPGVAYLEMARAAVRVALGANASHEPGHLHLSHVVWVHPLAVGEQPVTAQITLSPQESGTLAFLISPAGVPYAPEGSDPEDEKSTELVYCQGMALVGQAHKLQEDADGSTEGQCLDLPALQARCPHPISGTEIYQRYHELGLTYGPTFQAIEHLSVGEGELLARFCLPVAPGVAQTQTEFVLHPSILDAALHASIGLLIKQNTQMPLHVPFALSDLSIEGSVPTQGWTWIRQSPQSSQTEALSSDLVPTSMLDIEICDDAGRVAVRLRGLSTRPLFGSLQARQTLLLTPDWSEEAVTGPASASSPEDPAPDLIQALAPVASNETQQGVSMLGEEVLEEKVSAYFKKQLAALIKLPAQQIEASAPLSDYGFDSIMAIRFTNLLEKDFGPLSKTLLFEHPTLDSVSTYFLHRYPEQLRRVLGIEEAAVTTLPQATGGKVVASPTSSQTALLQPGLDPHHRLALLRKGTNPFLATVSVADEHARQDKVVGVGDIAIIGVAGRYPGARDLPTFWENLRTGRDCITEIPPERWDYRLYFDPDKNKPGTTYSKWGGFLDGVDEFDPFFFNISPREAERMDPQERLFLECAFATLEDAGYTRAEGSPKSYDRATGGSGTSQNNRSSGNVGVFVGVMYEEYQLFGAQAQIQGQPVTMSGNPSSIANRVSYFCNFHGPSLAVDTACSSSLTAIHLACESLQHGGCELAIAGGVNVSIHPNKYLMLGQGQFVSSKGSCQSFGVGADGYVPGEGVGAVLLKPLAQAEADGDHIYGVIKATAINHGGKTNGYTVPNPVAQAAVIEQAIKKAGIDPRTISYIEAHGTGTVLGDPIEIAGLTRAFEACGATDNVASGLAPGWCAIGSVKSNIGHAESASGIAGVTKVLLQMRYGQLVPSLHAEVLNPHIDFSATPFVVQQKLSPWKRPQMPDDRRDTDRGKPHPYGPCPRRAGISSFGAGGSNAHVILEEYVPGHQTKEKRNPHPSRPVIIVLSARTKEQLHERVQQLLAWIGDRSLCPNACGASHTGESPTDASEPLVQAWDQSLPLSFLENLAYTLQVGREAMEERLALQVRSLQELEEKLKRYLREPQEMGDWYRGQVRRHDVISAFATDEVGLQAVAAWMSKGKYEKLLELWVKGLTIDWKQLYTVGEGSEPRTIPPALTLPRRVSLPTYPFARERYWVPTTTVGTVPCACPPTAKGTSLPPSSFAALHPLVQRNTSTLWEQQFSSTFHGNEFFLADHVIAGQRILPGVAYLEMVRAAAREAIGANAPSEPFHLRQIVWVRPLIVGEHPITAHITLSPQEDGTIAFVIQSDTTGAGSPVSLEEETAEPISCQGVVQWDTEETTRSTTSQNLDVQAVQARCPHPISSTECYQRYRELSLIYGPAFQAIEHLSVGEDEMLARFCLPSVVAQTRTEFVLHPSVLDAALHASIGLLIKQNTQMPLHVPFALSDLAIEGSVPTQGWVWIRRSPQSSQTKALGSDLVPTSMLDIEICDDAGRVAVRLHGLSLRPFLGSLNTLRTLLLTPDWKEEAVTGPASASGPEDRAPDLTQAQVPAASNSLVLLCGLPDLLASRIQAQMPSGGRCRSLSGGKGMGASPISANLRGHGRQGQAQPLQYGTTSVADERPMTVGAGLAPAFAPMGADPTPQAPFQQSRRELRFQDVVLQLIQELQHLLHSRPAGSVLVQVVVSDGEEPSRLSALGSVLKVAQQEYPQLRGQLIEIEGEPEEGELLAYLRENQFRMSQESHICYREGKRWVRKWQEHPLISAPTTLPWKEGGCYLITGGAGGLARHFVEEIAYQVQEATVLLVGRSALSAEQRAQLAPRGRGKSLHIDYQQVDVSDGPAVHALIGSVLTHYGQLNGIIHAAGVLRNTRFFDKTPEEVRMVLSPKVIGVEQLDEASAEIPLDFFLLCSSLSAVLGGVGMVDYAAANAYLDAFAHARTAKVQAGERQGKTLSINWPYWEEGGMQADAEAIQMLQELLGEEPMGTEIGMKTLYQALALGTAQVVVLHGQVERIKQLFLQRPISPGEVEPSPSLPVQSVPDAGHPGGQTPGTVPTDKLREALTFMIADLLKVRVEHIDAETSLPEYGFDSITFTTFANRLNQTYQLDLTAPIFFEHSTIERLAQYLQATYAAVLAPHFAPVSPEMKTRKDFAPGSGTTDKVSPIGASPMATVTRRHARLPRSLVRISEQRAPVGTEPIAIIGMSGVFPQAPDVQSLWSNLLAGRDCIGEMPAERWDWPTSCGNTAATANPEKTNIKWAGVMEGMETFDPLFFGISPSEAEHMDPQQRMLMMYVWKVIEDAGYSAESLSGTDTALFVGTASTGYSERVFRANMAIEGYSSTGLAPSVGPNRMSYFLNLHGPSEAIDTACSSSLIAIHRGVSAIESGMCNMAIVGGVNTLVSPELHISFSKAGRLCEDGRCKSFSAEANGYVRGEGVGMLVLKKLSDAERDGDHIYGVIRGIAENHGGRSSSLTAPNPKAQADLLIAAYRKAGIDPRTVGYIEAHATGTSLGDPIEINGLKTAWSEISQVIGEGPLPQGTCGIGSLKSNIGHLELASGVAGVIKVLQQLQHKRLVKSLHCEQMNPYIQLEGSPFYIVQESREWEAPRDRMGNALPRRAGVSAFGFGGVNAHVVLEEYVPKPRARLTESLTQPPGRGQAPPLLIVLSARNEERLQEQVRQLLAWIQGGAQTIPTASEQQLEDVAYTLQVGREAMEERLALQVRSLAELEEKLEGYLSASVQEGGGWYRGQVKQYKEMVALLNIDEELQEAIGKWFQRSKYEKLLQWWVKGGPVDWRHLYGEHLPRRISLPTYPFARERYWVPIPKSD